MTHIEIELLEEREYKEQGLIYGEGGCRGMIMSCLIYDYGRDYFMKNYANYYVAALGQKRVEELWDDRENYFKNHCKVKHNVFIDGEGVSYNNVIEF